METTKEQKTNEELLKELKDLFDHLGAKEEDLKRIRALKKLLDGEQNENQG